jgi:hypothetical protein
VTWTPTVPTATPCVLLIASCRTAHGCICTPAISAWTLTWRSLVITTSLPSTHSNGEWPDQRFGCRPEAAFPRHNGGLRGGHQCSLTRVRHRGGVISRLLDEASRIFWIRQHGGMTRHNRMMWSGGAARLAIIFCASRSSISSWPARRVISTAGGMGQWLIAQTTNSLAVVAFRDRLPRPGGANRQARSGQPTHRVHAGRHEIAGSWSPQSPAEPAA